MKTNYNEVIGLLQFGADYYDMRQILSRIGLPELSRGMERYSFSKTGSAGWYHGDLNKGIVYIALSMTRDNLGRNDITANVTTINNSVPDFRGIIRLRHMKAQLEDIDLQNI